MNISSDNLRFDGQTAVVTGACGGIGRAVTLALARNGARVIATDLNPDALQTLRDEMKNQQLDCVIESVDVTDSAACRALAERVEQSFGPISVLVNSAGIAQPAQLDDTSFDEVYTRTMRINVDGTLNMTRAFADQLKQVQGSVVNLGSIASFIAGNSSIPYGTSKGAIRSLTQFLARDLGPYGVRVNAVAPGVTETPMTVRVRNDPDKLGKVVERTVLGRIAQPDEIARPILFLASPLASYITGVMIPVDGGYLAR